MNRETLYIKSMVCNRCTDAVRNIFLELGLACEHIALGEVQLKRALSDKQIEQLRTRLEAAGFALIDDQKTKLIEQIKTLIIELVHHSGDQDGSANLSEYIAKSVGKDYNYLSGLFSSIENTTIEKFHILQKIERVKELLVYGELSISEIAWQTGYSSVQHLSRQFKKLTGLTPSHFKMIGEKRRKPLDGVVD